MKRTVAFAFAILSLGLTAWAGSKSYTVAVYDPVLAGATELQPGDYQLKLDGDKATLHKGKVSAENPVKVETADSPYPATSVVLVKSDGKLRIKEIHLAGTKTKVVFTEAQP